MPRYLLPLAVLGLLAGSIHTLAEQPAAPSTAPNPAQTSPTDAASPSPDEAKKLKENASYALGYDIGTELRPGLFALDLEHLIAGLRDAAANKPPKLSADEIRQAIAALQKTMLERQAAQAREMEELARKNKAQAQAFLETNKNAPGIVVTASGLQYRVLQPGDGPTPGPHDVVRVHYRGTLIDGTEFDSSYAHNQPLTLPVDRVIPGWSEALQLMKVGSKFQLFIPPELAYGPEPIGDKIGPNSLLIFEVELLSIEPAPTPSAPEAPAQP